MSGFTDAAGPLPPAGLPAPATGPVESATRRERAAALFQRTGAFVVLIVVTLLGAIAFGPRFANVNNFLNIIEASSFLALVAIGMTFVIIGGGIDLSGGSMLALAAVLAAFAAQSGESLVALALPLLVGGAIGLANGVLIARGRMAPFIVTLAALLFARGLAFAVADNGNTVYIISRDLWFVQLGQGSLFGIRWPIWIAGTAFLIGWIVLERTRYGLAVSAIGGSEEASRLMGLPISRVKIAIYTVSALLATLAGILRRSPLVVGALDHRGGPRAPGDRRGGHRGHPPDRGVWFDAGHAGRRPVAGCHRQPHQPGRHTQLIRAAGRQRGLPAHRRRHPDHPHPGAAPLIYGLPAPEPPAR